MKYLLFIHQDGPIVGAVEVPGCFEPTQALLDEADQTGLTLSFATADQLDRVGGLAGLLLHQGAEMLKILGALATASPSPDPRLN